MSDRARILRDFASGKLCALSTVGTISEGQDLPCADTCIFAEPRQSRVAVVQCIGRVLRKHDAKIMAHVVVPYTHDDEAEVARIISALEDPRITHTFRARGNRVEIVSGHKVREDDMAREDDERAIGDARILYESIFNRLGVTIRGSFDIKLDVLREFVAEFNRIPTQREQYRDIRLGGWIRTLRQSKKRGTLSQDRIRACESIPHWVWSALVCAFQTNLDVLREFVAEFNRIPTQSEQYRDIRLGEWIRTLRKSKKRGTLSQDRIRACESITHWVWSAR
jgi:hypothetical protein